MGNEVKAALPPRKRNRLAGEKSPYLLQHQYNPVDWHPWGTTAFEKARQENKIIFLSIGYSTCHWCHVMERESFEDEKVAEYLNQHFVTIKVDREERPDVDRIYMTALQALGGRGGWPLNLFLTPDLKPFYGGTYFPPAARGGQLGFIELLKRVQELWHSRRQDILKSSGQIHAQLEEYVRKAGRNGVTWHPHLLAHAAKMLKQDFDATHGGFGGAPKFPQPSLLGFLLRWGISHQDDDAVGMVAHTCRQMAAGGIYDQVGGGFSRYSVDEQWLVPHFEKMLYDNAQLLELYLDLFLVTREARFARVARGIADYILRDMTHAEGGFFSAEDADSEGREGKFYCWTLAELKEILSPDELDWGRGALGISEAGNFVDHSDPNPLPGQNVISLARMPQNAAEEQRQTRILDKLFHTRQKRVRPHRDDKILASWNGLMLGSLARASVILEMPEYLEAAQRNSAFVRKYLWDARNKVLYHRWREGERDAVQLLSAYASQVAGHLALYEVTLNPDALALAVEIAESMVARFEDRELGGFWQSEKNSDLILQIKEDYDGAEPSGNALAAMALIKLASLTDRSDFGESARRVMNAFHDRMLQIPQAMPHLLSAALLYTAASSRVVVTGEPTDPRVRQLLKTAHQVYHPSRLIMGASGPVSPFALNLGSGGNQPAAYCCSGNACQLPVHEPAALKTLLQPQQKRRPPE